MTLYKLLSFQLPNGRLLKVDHGGDADKERESLQYMIEQYSALEAQTNPSVSIPEVRQLSLKEVIANFLKEGQQNWTSQTYKDYAGRLRVVEDILGSNTLFHRLSTNDTLTLKDTLFKYPKNTRSKEFKGKTWTDIEASDIKYTSLTPQTVKQYMSRFKAVATYAKQNSYHHIDIAENIDLKNIKRTHKDRLAFNTRDLELIFNGYIFTNTPPPRKRELLTAYFWGPLIALHTGARLNEIAQLRVQDIFLEHDTPHFEFDSNGSANSLKNHQSKRAVPVHSRLIDIGFLEFISENQFQKSPEDRLFTGLTYDLRNGWGKKLSRWFNGDNRGKGYKSLLERPLSEPNSLVFESFRATFVQNLSNQGISDRYIKMLIGHDTEKDVLNDYTGTSILELKKAQIERLDYKINLSHIKYKEFKQFIDKYNK